VFIDTPGMHKPRTRLGEYMVKSIVSAIREVDAALLVVEPAAFIHKDDDALLARFKRGSLPVILAINKIDAAGIGAAAKTIEVYKDAYDFASIIPVSALKNRNCGILMDELLKFAVDGEWLFPGDIATDQPERRIASEVIREKLLRLLDDEIPHGTAVTVERYIDRGSLLEIFATVYCERDSHKGIIIGRGGELLKKVSTYAREDLEELFGQKIYLNIWVKVKKDWRESDTQINDFGLGELK